MIGNIRKEKAWFLLAYKESNKLTSYNLGKQQGNGKAEISIWEASEPSCNGRYPSGTDRTVSGDGEMSNAMSNAMGCAERHMLNGEMQVGHGQLHPSLLTGTLIQRLSSFKS